MFKVGDLIRVRSNASSNRADLLCLIIDLTQWEGVYLAKALQTGETFWINEHNLETL